MPALARALAAAAAVGLCAGVVSSSVGAVHVANASAGAVFACPPSNIGEIVAWRRSDVVTARLVNGVVAHHRRMPGAGFTVVAMTLTPGIDDDAAGASAAAAAESMLSDDPRAQGLRVDVMSTERSLMAVIRGPDDRASDMLGLVARLAGDPIEFEPRDARRRAGSARTVIRRAIDDVLDQRPVEVDEAAAAAHVEVDRPVVRWSAADRPCSVEVAIVGGGSLADALAAVGSELGDLAPREAPAPTDVPAAPIVPCGGHKVVIQGRDAGLPEGREAVGLGLLVTNGRTLAGQRTIALASTLLRLRLAGSLSAKGDADVKPSVQFTPRGARPGVGLITVSATCPTGAGERVAAEIDQALRRLASEPVTSDEFDRARAAYLEVARELLGDVTYWAGVLTTCSSRGYTPDDLAGAESDLKSMTPGDVANVLTRALAEGPPVVVHVRPGPNTGQP